jgi:cytidylate kinase
MAEVPSSEAGSRRRPLAPSTTGAQRVMNPQTRLEHCLSFINCNLQAPHRTWEAHHNGEYPPVITISRETGSGGHAVAEHLAQYLQEHWPPDSCRWTVFDKNLVEKVLEEHHLPRRLAQFMPEDRTSDLADTMDELFGLHPPAWTLVRQTAETVLHLAMLGHVIIIGRGANIITARLPQAFHVRLVGSLEKRVKYVEQASHLSPQAARDMVEREDLGRRRYLKKYFNKETSDPLLYHLIINTDWVSFADAAQLIGEAVLSKMRSEFGVAAGS